jgi:hypothetical protein
MTSHLFTPNNTTNIPEALGLLKDWINTIIEIETAALGLLGALFAFGNSRPLDSLEAALLYVTLAAFILSIIYGSFVLNMLQGACNVFRPRTRTFTRLGLTGSEP